MVGFKITATYIPDNTVVTPDATLGAWGDAFEAWGTAVFQTYNAGELSNLAPDGPNISGFLDYVDASDSTGPVLSPTVVWDIGIQSPFDLAAFQAVFELAAASAPALAALAAFDSVGTVTFDSVYVEQWSDEETI